jgi:hypothetical protein
LLENIYRTMDRAAKRYNVFKVETVGDCYVAATGLPHPQPNHALLMIYFARSCVVQVSRLTRKLESALGPGTGDLAMRFGIHSGPVTAGVLRGQKARFQLFGDTMNMTARLENSSFKNRIHISSDTADLVIHAGYEHLVIPREDKVELKGKGEVTTYWVVTGSHSKSQASSGRSVSDTSEPDDAMALSTPIICDLAVSPVVDGVIGQTRLCHDLERLVEWNTEVLSTLLKRVLSSRVAANDNITKTGSLKPGEGMAQWRNKLARDDIQLTIPLPDYDEAVANAMNNTTLMKLPSVVRAELRDYVACIASGYKVRAFLDFVFVYRVGLSIECCRYLTDPAFLPFSFVA